ncbi:MAG: hypothetical protein J4G05_09405 [Chlorobi bacterium]|nr:hypothetical protein [Chlorobiota bacterium]
MRIISSGLIVLCALVIECQNLAAQGWPQEKGSGYYKLGLNVVRSDMFYESDGQRTSIPTLSNYTVSLYGEQGITDRITGILYLPFLKRITLNRQVGEPSGFVFFEGDEATGIADADVGVRVGLLQTGGTVVTAGLKLGLPLGSDDQEYGLYTGDGEFNQIITAGVGYSFYPVPAYSSAYVGLNNRSNGYSEEFLYGLEIGYTFGERVNVIGRLTGLNSLKNGNPDVTGGMEGSSANNQSYLVYGLEGAWQITGTFGVSVGVSSAFFGRNALSAPAFSLGLFLKI